MNIDRALIDHLARLARLELTEAEKASMEHDLTEILALMEQLAAVDVSGVEETARVLPIQNVFRQDVPAPSANRDEILANAPESRDGCFAVPRVIG